MPSKEIKLIGIVLGMDKGGYIVSQSSPEKIMAPWDKPVAELKDKYLEMLGDTIHSIYIRGSVGHGNAIPDVSDLDAYIVVHGAVDEIDLSWSKEFGDELQSRFPFVRGVEAVPISVERIVSGKNRFAQFMIKLMGACVYGRDLISQLPNFKPGPDIYGAILRIGERVEPGYLDGNPKLSDAQKMRWTTKQILRAGFEMVMEQEQCYTRDLYPCYKIFSKVYPDKEPLMRRALEMAIYPTNDKATLNELLNDFGPWLAKEAGKKVR